MILIISLFINNLLAKNMENKNILVVYYSHSGNTESIANAIHKKVGGDIFEIELVEPYTDNYNDLVEQAKEDLKNGNLPALKDNVKDIEKYDIIFIGSPNWWGTIALPVMSFLKENNLSGKKIIPFITNGGGGKQNTIKDLIKLCSGCDVEENAFVTYGNSATNLDNWLLHINNANYFF